MSFNSLSKEFITSETNRGKKCLLHDGYVYRLDAVLRRTEREKHQFLMRQYNKLPSGEIDRSGYVRTVPLLGFRYSASF